MTQKLKNNLKGVFIIVAISFLLLCVAFLWLLSSIFPKYPYTKSRAEWIETYQSNTKEFEFIASRFLADDISQIQMQTSNNSTTCEEKKISNCTAFASKKGDIYLNGYKLEQDNEYVKFMQKYKIPFMNKAAYPDTNFQIDAGSFGSCGLKYFPNSATKFEEDGNYFAIQQINSNWYYYCEDWN